MKKLMMALAALSLAGTAQARGSYVDTTASNIYNGGGNEASLYSGTAYIITSTEATPAAILNLMADALEGETPSSASSVAAERSVATVDIKSGAISASLSSASFNTAFYYSFVAFNEDYSSMFYSGPQQVKRSGSTYSLTFGDFSGISKTSQELDLFNQESSAGWYSPVPEPTSGLLMLVGLAGLALKRKRA